MTWAHRRWRGLREDATRRILDDRRDLGPELEHDLDLLVEKTNPLSWSCCIAVPRPVWDDLGGFDERFRGWGFEDMAFQSVVLGLYGAERVSVLPADEEAVGAVAQTIEDEWGEGDRIREALAPLVRPADVYHLHHPRSEERVQQGRPATTASPDYVDNGRLGRRYMVALRRDYGLHDRAGVETPMDDDERDRDIANLIRDDAHFELLARRANRPDWSDWWPTLDELVEGAKEERFGKTSEVAMVVRTGGEDETFEVRSGYLRRSLASLVERVHGPITRRVIYSDWSERFRPELDAIATEFGFYIVGGGHHGYTPAVRRLWRYLEARVSEPFVFLAEDDFVYLRDVELAPLVDALRRASRIRQIALLRGPCYPREFEEGGILGWPDADFSPAEAGTPRARIEHRLFWTMNPSLFARSIASTAWPQVRSSERAFGDLLLRDPRAVFAFAGDGEPWIEHIGEVRSTDAY